MGSKLEPRHHYNAAGWPTNSFVDVICENGSQEEAFRVADAAVKADPQRTLCEVSWWFMKGWKTNRYVSPSEYECGGGTRHLVYADAFINKEVFSRMGC